MGTLPATRPAWQRADVLLAVAAGGCLGASARHGLAVLLPTPAHGFPWSTFAVNVSGALVLGILLEVLLERFGPTRYVRAFLGTGVLGSYTTFSTYMVETVLLAREDRVVLAIAYLLGSLVVGMAAAWLGMVIGRLIGRAGRGVER